MKIKRMPLYFENVIKLDIEADKEGFVKEVEAFRNRLIKSNAYTTSPLIYQNFSRDSETMKFRLMMALNQPIESKAESIEVLEKIEFTDGLSVRYAHPDEDIWKYYELLDKVAKDNGLETEKPFYHIKSEVFGEPIIDIYAPCKEINDGQ